MYHIINKKRCIICNIRPLSYAQITLKKSSSNATVKKRVCHECIKMFIAQVRDITSNEIEKVEA